MEEKDAMWAKDLGLANLVQGLRSGSPGPSASRSGASSFGDGVR